MRIRFWGNEFEYTKQVLRIDQGGIVERDASCSVDEERSEDAASALDSGENLPDAHHVHLLCVMDPFITDKVRPPPPPYPLAPEC